MSPSPPPAAATASQRSCRNVTARSINHAVDLLNNLQAKRDSKRQRHSPTLRDDDTDHDSPAPVLDAFIQAKGPNVVHQMTNFSLSEFNVLWSDLQSTVNRRWNNGSGRKCDVTGRDMLFMAVTSMKHCGTWDVVATMFAAASPTFSKRVITFLEAIHPHLKTKYIDNVGAKWTMEHLTSTGQRFANFPAALYAVDVEASVVPTGFAINVTAAVPGSVADISIFEANEAFHADKMRKTDAERDMPDAGPMLDEYPNDWAILADKGYQGLHRRMRAITPAKRAPGGLLTMSDMEYNDNIATDRVIVENYFGRLKTLWAIVNESYTWKRENYDLYLQTCVALTNCHIRFSPLRVDDSHERNRYLNALMSSSEKKKAKRAVAVKKHREKRKLRLGTFLPSGENAYFDSDTEFYPSGDDSGIFE
ncbi:hypothetical protein DYB34_009546 [Aphanomyces astaci]|uniref:DDE Tnp4 domain-containing protein n=1 Tax=Aphanomyces astaci TaxID=112090 RepID=A0A418BHK0_APHAT|nr:hypothetical protein DYB34_009546 [Aphanomyces astaci]